MPGHEPPPRTPVLRVLGNFCAAEKTRAVKLMPKAVRSDPCAPCSGTPLDSRNLSPQESEEESKERAARARAYYEKMHPLHPTDPFGSERMNRVKTTVGLERLCNQVMREQGPGEPTRAQRRALRAEIREPGLAAEEIDKNAFRHPENRQRCPRFTRGRRPAGWKSIHFVLPAPVIEGLCVLTRSVAERQRAERSQQPHGERRRCPRTKNFFVIQALNELLEKHGFSQFCVLERPVQNGKVRRFTVEA